MICSEWIRDVDCEDIGKRIWALFVPGRLLCSWESRSDWEAKPPSICQFRNVLELTFYRRKWRIFCIKFWWNIFLLANFRDLVIFTICRNNKHYLNICLNSARRDKKRYLCRFCGSTIQKTELLSPSHQKAWQTLIEMMQRITWASSNWNPSCRSLNIFSISITGRTLQYLL